MGRAASSGVLPCQVGYKGSTMNPADLDRIADGLVRGGLDGRPEAELLGELCERCRDAGLAIARAVAFIDTLHPVHEGSVFRWRDDGAEERAVVDYGRSDEGQAAESWQRSAF